MPRPKKIYDLQKIEADNELLDRVAKRFGSRSDRDLAKRLGIPTSTMSQVRRRSAELAWHHRVVVMDKLGFLFVRKALGSIVPQALARRFETFTNSEFEKISRRRYERELRSDDANLVNFLDAYEALAEHPGFKAHFGLTDAMKENIRRGAVLSREQRVKLLEALYVADPNLWSLDWSRLSLMLEDTSVLLDEIERCAFPMDRNAELNAALLLHLEPLYGSGAKLAEKLDLPPSQLSQIKKGNANLGMRARLIILSELEKASGRGDLLNFSDLDKLANDPELIRNRLEQGLLT
ncbi:MAG: hypothetical protein C9356_02805 [Oleiphilus sp.]|nr:MAG: hypothetical protein C9356_02805 [Oleiphilus sp.]